MSDLFEEVQNRLEALEAMPSGRPLLDSCACVPTSASRGVEESANDESIARPIRRGPPGVEGTLNSEGDCYNQPKAISVDFGCA